MEQNRPNAGYSYHGTWYRIQHTITLANLKQLSDHDYVLSVKGSYILLTNAFLHKRNNTYRIYPEKAQHIMIIS